MSENHKPYPQMTPESPTPSGATLCPFFDKPITWEEAYAKKMIECVGLYEKLAALRTVSEEMAGALERVAKLYPSLAQLLQGWHSDGTAWSEWDQHVYDQMLLDQREVEAVLNATPKGLATHTGNFGPLKSLGVSIEGARLQKEKTV